VEKRGGCWRKETKESDSGDPKTKNGLPQEEESGCIYLHPAIWAASTLLPEEL